MNAKVESKICRCSIEMVAQKVSWQIAAAKCHICPRCKEVLEPLELVPICEQMHVLNHEPQPQNVLVAMQQQPSILFSTHLLGISNYLKCNMDSSAPKCIGVFVEAIYPSLIMCQHLCFTQSYKPNTNNSVQGCLYASTHTHMQGCMQRPRYWDSATHKRANKALLLTKQPTTHTRLTALML